MEDEETGTEWQDKNKERRVKIVKKEGIKKKERLSFDLGTNC